MNFAFVYVVNRFFFRLSDFFHHWYIDGSRTIAHGFVSFLERVDQVIALRITFLHFFQPLYKDFTFIGRVLGVVFRSIRLIIGIAVYAGICAFFLGFYLAWIFLPLFFLISSYAAFKKGYV
ncbi:MAG: hypothetical protein AAB495_03250 [Patescibacteria group bacterium]